MSTKHKHTPRGAVKYLYTPLALPFRICWVRILNSDENMLVQGAQCRDMEPRTTATLPRTPYYRYAIMTFEKS